MAKQIWRDAGRPGEPRIVGAVYFALGPDARERSAPYIHQYYGDAGMAEAAVQQLPVTPDAIRETVSSFREAGADELILWPCVPDIDMVEALADIVGVGAP
jgi:hypothetical protein